MKISAFTPFRPRQSLVLLLTIILTVWLVACKTAVPGSAKDQEGWVSFTSADGGFSILMPNTPEESIKEQSEEGGSVTKLHQFIVAPNKSLELGVIYNDFPEDLPSTAIVGSASFFDTLQEAALKQLGEGRLVYALDGKFISYPMREIRFEVPEKNIFYQTRIIVVGHRMYQLILVSSAGVDVSQEAEILFTSFHLLYRQ